VPRPAAAGAIEALSAYSGTSSIAAYLHRFGRHWWPLVYAKLPVYLAFDELCFIVSLPHKLVAEAVQVFLGLHVALSHGGLYGLVPVSFSRAWPSMLAGEWLWVLCWSQVSKSTGVQGV